jgi:putative addiction module component (TIGR02574 family)
MSASHDLSALTTQALALPPQQRVELAQRLWESVEGQLDEDDELFAEIERRTAEVDSGAVQPITYEQAMREIRASLDEYRNHSAGPT